MAAISFVHEGRSEAMSDGSSELISKSNFSAST